MKKKIILFFNICIMFTFSTYSQEAIPVKQYLTKFQRVIFKAKDSSFKFTRFEDQYGNFCFGEGYGDTSYTKKNIYCQYKKNKLKKEYNYKYIKTVDTLKSYFPVKYIKKIDTNINSVQYLHLNIIDETNFSYILKQLGEPIIFRSNQNMIRFIYSGYNTMQGYLYILIKIKFVGVSAKLYSTCLYFKDYKREIINDSCNLSLKEIKNLKKQLTQTNQNSNYECRFPGDPWLLEYNDGNSYNYFIISYQCAFLKKNNNNKKFANSLKIFNIMINLNKKYFKNCKSKQNLYKL